MPSKNVASKIINYGGSTIGRELKSMSDYVVDSTWGNDIGDQRAYLYNYATDNEPLLRSGMSHYDDVGCLKHPVDVRFLISGYKSASKDDVEAHIIFKPEDWNSGAVIPSWWGDPDVGGVDYRGLDIDFPIGCFIDIQNDKGVYERWLIIYTDHANQFKKFGIVRCNYLLQWVTDKKNARYIRQSWCAERTQNSYNSGVYQYDKFQVMENQGKMYLPYNHITSELFYNQRVIVSMPTITPLTWTITKVENTLPKGINYITLYQDEFNNETDAYWSPDDLDNPLPGEWCFLADYFERPVTPIPEPPEEPINTTMVISCGNPQIYIGRSKTLTATCFNANGEDITANYSSFTWSYSIDGVDVSNIITQTQLADANKVKITFDGDEQYAFKTLSATCVATMQDDTETTNTLDISILA